MKETALLELYTSEGCSSCPPAEEWVSGLKDSPGLWTDFVPVVWHVDYWDSLGWRDPWASGQNTDRQRVYAAAWHSDSVYTPALVLNGKEWLSWGNSKAGPSAPEAETGILKVSSPDQQHWKAQFFPMSPDTGHYQIHAAWLASGLGSDVRAGENSGRHLIHDFVVLALVDQELAGGTNKFRTELSLDAGGKNTGCPAVAFWVTRPGDLEPVQAVGGWLVQPVNR